VRDAREGLKIGLGGGAEAVLAKTVGLLGTLLPLTPWLHECRDLVKVCKTKRHVDSVVPILDHSHVG
jgi:hypothetical protein